MNYISHNQCRCLCQCQVPVPDARQPKSRIRNCRTTAARQLDNQTVRQPDRQISDLWQEISAALNRIGMRNNPDDPDPSQIKTFALRSSTMPPLSALRTPTCAREFVVLPARVIESSWVALWLGIQPFLCFRHVNMCARESVVLPT